jgi:serine/threonine protein kinase
MKEQEEEKIKNLPNLSTVINKKYKTLKASALYSTISSFESDYIKLKEIGSGGSGRVFRVRQKNSDLEFAAKLFHLDYEEEKEKIREEFALTKLSTHSNIVQHHLLCEDESEFCIIQELMDFSLTGILKKNSPIPEVYSLFILKEVLEGLKFIHSNFRIHRDIKSDNILMNYSGDIKIGDLGFAAQLTLENQSRNTVAGTPCWLAPEICTEQPYDMKVDIWAFGVVCIELIDGEPPFFRNPLQTILRKTINGRISLKNKDQVSEKFNEMIQHCLQVLPEDRLSAKDLLDLPIFRNISKPADFSGFLKKRLMMNNRL